MCQYNIKERTEDTDSFSNCPLFSRVNVYYREYLQVINLHRFQHIPVETFMWFFYFCFITEAFLYAFFEKKNLILYS